ncbi:threonine-phosphate decarboxylase CobD [Motilimonas sp. E26]|uniref:threonine-phosphate decarboxylase CobD n=1 Tax=Motilimonas sp. E26 TaxID=2865674 RepID=UPI001E36F143|nr:threonine-phosphate decarboxylase CobD [Motilimonas sp. E26]MCE0558908.1 threonine-phosphate decarboxylase CobD [Motilimonas sp. E26]
MELHGGNIHKLARDTDTEEWWDFSANINPLGLPESVKTALVEQLSCLTVYPDPEYVKLRQALANYCDQPISHILHGNGATELIYLYFRAIKPRRILIVAPTFAEYERAATSAGAQVDYCVLDSELNFQLSTEQIALALAQHNYDVLVVCNPNNPTGGFIAQEQMKRLAELALAHQCRMLVDEAFIEFVDDGHAPSIADLGLSHVFVVRALTKFFALPGIRLGFAINADQELTQQVNHEREPWSVNALAEVAAISALQDQAYIQGSLRWLQQQREYLLTELHQLAGWHVYPSRVNFVLCRLPTGLTASNLRQRLLKQGIVIRDASNFYGLDQRYIRLAVKSQQDNQRLIDALQLVLA